MQLSFLSVFIILQIENEYKLQISELESTIENLKQQLSENDNIVSTLEEKVFQFETDKENVVQENEEMVRKLKDEINTMRQFSFLQYIIKFSYVNKSIRVITPITVLP